MNSPSRGLITFLTTATLIAVPHAAAAAPSSQNPPRGCAEKTYTSGNYSARVTLCLTEATKRHVFGPDTLEPTDTVTLKCWYRGFLWNNANCVMNSKLSLLKDGVLAWTEARQNIVDIARGGTTNTVTDHYACRANGEYELRLESGRVAVVGGAAGGAQLDMPMFSVKARGCR
ncbi:hypothetical protein [Nonomuraea ceibae]|uniref:hypothetical protein n=1 Tax=Nonomuraea ceibae TaxID=1935170 RepID=UPI001C5CCC13|nr:hypothetical protein [Nonomuraea ceibae]